MPCKPKKARYLLNLGKAKVVSKLPFTIQLLYGSSGYIQKVTGAMDAGSKAIGCAASANSQIIYQSEVKLRTDISKKMRQRAMYRRTRRLRKCRYRPARWANRASMRKEGRLAPSVKSKLDSHLREKKQVEAILPIRHWKVETASFDIHKLTNPHISNREYQNGCQKGFYNVKAYVLHRDNYACQSHRKVKHSSKLHVHHIVFRSQGGTNSPENLITLCELCHDALHRNEYHLKQKRSKTKHATEVGIIKEQLKKVWSFEETFGFETKFKREQILKLPKTHYFDAAAICCDEKQVLKPSATVIIKRHVSSGDYQKTKGIRSEKQIPVGKLYGLRKYDRVKTEKGIGFIKGKRSSGYFALEDIHSKTLTSSVNIKRNIERLSSRSTTLKQLIETAIPLGTKVPSILADL